MAELDVLAEAAATHPEGSEGGSPQPTANGGGRGRQRRGQQPARAGSSARGGSPSGATSAPLSKALVAAQVEQEHRARLSEGSDNALVQWATAVHEEVAGADKAFLAARDAHRAVRFFSGIGGCRWARLFPGSPARRPTAPPLLPHSRRTHVDAG
jgi:hypothetical protein